MRDFLDIKRQKIEIGDYCLRVDDDRLFIVEILSFTDKTYQFTTVQGSRYTYKSYGRIYINKDDPDSMYSHQQLLKIDRNNPLVKVLCS